MTYACDGAAVNYVVAVGAAAGYCDGDDECGGDGCCCCFVTLLRLLRQRAPILFVLLAGLTFLRVLPLFALVFPENHHH